MNRKSVLSKCKEAVEKIGDTNLLVSCQILTFAKLSPTNDSLNADRRNSKHSHSKRLVYQNNFDIQGIPYFLKKFWDLVCLPKFLCLTRL